MAGATLAVFDADNCLVCRNGVDDHKLANTDGIFRSVLELVAPPSAGSYSWIVRSDVTDVAEPHDESVIELSLLVVDAPLHRLLITLVDEDGCPPDRTLLRFGPYRRTTGPDGRAEFLVASGTYLMQSWHPDYELIFRELDVGEDSEHTFTVRSLPGGDVEFL